MAAQSLANATEASRDTVSEVRNLPRLLHVLIAGISVRYLFQDNRLRFKLRDLHRVLGYKSLQTGALRRIFENHGYNFFDFVLRLPDGRNAAMFLSTDGLRIVAELCKPERTEGLRKWLEDGGLSAITAQFGQQQDVAATAQPPELAPIFGNAATPGGGEEAGLSAHYHLFTAEHDGTPVSMMIYAGKTWLLADEVAALLQDEACGMNEISALVDSMADANEPEGATARVRVGGLGVVRLLDLRALHILDFHLDSDRSEALAAWFGTMTAAPAQAGAPEVADSPAATPVADSLDALEQAHNDLYAAYRLILSQVRAIKRTAEEDTGNEQLSEVFDLAETAGSLTSKLDELADRLDEIHRDLRARLLRQPDEGDRVPDFVWLGVIEKLSAERQSWGDEDMWHLCQQATALERHARLTPEAGVAVACVKAFAHRQGALIYPHEPSGTMAHMWLEGRAPHQRQHRPVAH